MTCGNTPTSCVSQLDSEWLSGIAIRVAGWDLRQLPENLISDKLDNNLRKSVLRRCDVQSKGLSRGIK